MNTKSWHRLLSRAPQTNKYDYGHVLILGGSEAMVGAPVLAGRAALRTGAGLVTIASSSETVKLVDRDIEEVMTLSLPPWADVEKIIDTIKTFIKTRQVSALVIGPGLPAAADETIRALLLSIELPMVLDAEAFTALSGHLSVLESAAAMNKNIILTPHPGEYARLIGSEAQHDAASERAEGEKFAQKYNATLILKHHHTLVFSSTGGIYTNTTGSPGLATAGTGDVLSGIIAGIVAQKIEPYEASKMAVYLHGLAGDVAAKSKTEPGMIASDIIETIPQALQLLDAS